MLEDDKAELRKIIIDNKQDKDVQITRGYGKHNLQQPKDYIEEFTNYIKEKAVNEKNNENKIIYIQQLNETLEKLKKENEKLVLENKDSSLQNGQYPSLTLL